MKQPPALADVPDVSADLVCHAREGDSYYL